MYPEAIDHGIKEEENAKFYYSKVSEKKHRSFNLKEPGLLTSRSYSWIGAGLDGIRKFQCCDPTVVEIKWPFKAKDLDPKIAFLLPTVGRRKDENGNFFSWQKIIYINYSCFRRKAQVLKCMPFLGAKRGVMVPGVPCVDRGNWGWECSNLCCYVLDLRKQHKSVLYEVRFAKIPVLYAHHTSKCTRFSWWAHTKWCRAFSEWADPRTL